MPKFKYLAPLDLREASAVLREHQGQIAICGGGTELIPHLKLELGTPAYVLSLKKLTELTSLHYDRDAGFTLGATRSLKNLSADTYVRRELPALAHAAEEVASPQIRNMATIGGNVCLDTRCWYFNRSKRWRIAFPPCYKVGGDRCYVVERGKQCYALFQSDTVPSLLVMKARLRLVSFDGERIIPLREFYSDRGETPNRLSTDEILTEIHIPRLPPHSGVAYVKYGKRGTINFPILGVASLVSLDREGKSSQEARFAMTGVGPGPLVIEGSDLFAGLDQPELTEDLLKHLLQEMKPVTHMGISASLKRRIARVLLQEAFRNAWKRAKGSKPR